MMSHHLDSAVMTARALSHPARLRIVAMLRSGELCVCQITHVLDLATSTVSAHLRELKLAELVTERKDGRWVYFDLNDSPSAGRWIETALAHADHDPQLADDNAAVTQLRWLPVEDLCRLGFEGARSKWIDTLTAKATTE
jgi:arsenate reductase/ArsR family transcriptional regulator